MEDWKLVATCTYTNLSGINAEHRIFLAREYSSLAISKTFHRCQCPHTKRECGNFESIRLLNYVFNVNCNMQDGHLMPPIKNDLNTGLLKVRYSNVSIIQMFVIQIPLYLNPHYK